MTRSALGCPRPRAARWEDETDPRTDVRIPGEVSTMQQIRISRRPQPPRRPSPLDLRTPSGRPLPY